MEGNINPEKPEDSQCLELSLPHFAMQRFKNKCTHPNFASSISLQLHFKTACCHLTKITGITFCSTPEDLGNAFLQPDWEFLLCSDWITVILCLQICQHRFLQILQEQNTMRKNLHLRQRDAWCSCSVSAFYPAVIWKLLLVLLIQDPDMPVTDTLEWIS